MASGSTGSPLHLEEFAERRRPGAVLQREISSALSLPLLAALVLGRRRLSMASTRPIRLASVMPPPPRRGKDQADCVDRQCQ
nr:unnamed protein product [Digitaria exilis]